MRFPATAVILPGQRLVIAVDGAAFMAAFGGLVPNYQINPTSAVVPDMIDMGNNAPRSTALLTNTAECVVLYHCDGQSDNVCDNDDVTWGAVTTSNRVDKTGVAIDGPDRAPSPVPSCPTLRRTRTPSWRHRPHGCASSARRARSPVSRRPGTAASSARRPPRARRGAS